MSESNTVDTRADFRRQKRLARWRLTPRRLKWVMGLYPPLLINGVRAVRVSEDFRALRVKLSKTWLNTNFNGAIFGGTVTAAFDPWLGVMYWQILNHHGYQALVVNYALNVRFKKPALGSVWMDFLIPETDVAAALERLAAGEKYVKSYFVDAVDRKNEVIASAEVVVHMRVKQPNHRPNVSF